MRRGTILIVTVAFSMALLAIPATAKRNKKSDEPPPPEAGAWFDYRGTQCYMPPAFDDEPNEPKRRMLRQGATEEMLRLLRGEVNEQIVVSDERKIDAWETDFLGKPTGIEAFVNEGLDKCKAFAEGELGLSSYVSWLTDGGKRATVGDCHNPLAYELHQNLSVQDGWQVRRHMCADDQVLIETTESNKYTVADSGDYETTVWINPAGDLDQPEAGEGFPCPHCPVGAVIYRFEFEDGSREPELGVLGVSLEYKAPANGHISFTVNDLSYFDNTFQEANGVIDYLPLSIYPPIMGVDVGEGD